MLICGAKVQHLDTLVTFYLNENEIQKIQKWY
jgi:hypothetical protein